MPSFDVVSRTNLMEVDNAINGVKREIKQRYDLAGTKCDLTRHDDILTLVADDTTKLEQVESLLRKYLSLRKVDRGAFEFQTSENGAGDTIKRNIVIKQGIEGDLGRLITKTVKSMKLKVQVAVKGSELHVTGKKRDDLQEVIVVIKNMKNNQPLQYVNFRN